MAVQPALSQLAQQLVNQPPKPVLLVLSQLAQIQLRKLKHILTLTILATLPI